MSKRTIEQEITELIADIIEMDSEKVDPNANLVEDLGMDSMMALEILASIEKRYKIIIPEEALSKFTSLNKTVDVIKEILKEK